MSLCAKWVSFTFPWLKTQLLKKNIHQTLHALAANRRATRVLMRKDSSAKDVQGAYKCIAQGFSSLESFFMHVFCHWRWVLQKGLREIDCYFLHMGFRKKDIKGSFSWTNDWPGSLEPALSYMTSKASGSRQHQQKHFWYVEKT